MKKTEVVIRYLLECQKLLQKQLDAQAVMLDSRNQQVRVLEKTAAFLESRNETLPEASRSL